MVVARQLEARGSEAQRAGDHSHGTDVRSPEPTFLDAPRDFSEFTDYSATKDWTEDADRLA